MPNFQATPNTTFRGDHFIAFAQPAQLAAEGFFDLQDSGAIIIRLQDRADQTIFSTMVSQGPVLVPPTVQTEFAPVLISFDLFDWTSGVPVHVGVLTDVLMSFNVRPFPIYAPGTSNVIGYTYVAYALEPVTTSAFGGDMTVAVGSGDDVVLHFGSGSLLATLGDGNDTAYLYEASQNAPYQHVIDAGRGNDTVYVQSGNGSFFGGRGDDAFGLNGNNDGVWTLDGGAGADTLYANEFSTIIDRPGSGNDTYYGGGSFADAPTLSYASGTTGIFLDLTGPVMTSADHGNDILIGIFGRIIGTSGDDTMIGPSYNNGFGGTRGTTLDGRGGADALSGGFYADTLLGGAGLDVLTGGGGRDILTGGADADAFVYLDRTDSAARLGIDRITDFDPGVDVIDLSAIDARPIGNTGDQAFVFIGSAAFSAEGQVRFEQQGNKTFVLVNIEGRRGDEMRIELSGLLTLTEQDFIL